MPIVFEQPQPVSPQISEGYGRAQQWSQDFPTLEKQQQGIASAYENAAHLAAQQRMAAIDSNQRGQIASAEFQSRERQQQYGVEGDLAQQAMRNQGQLQAQQQHAELAVWANNQDMTYADNLRLQKMQASASAVQAQMQTGQLDAETGAALLTQLRTGIDPMRARLEKTQTKHMEMQNKQIDQQMQQQAAHELSARELAAKTLPQRTKTVPLPGAEESAGAQFDQLFPDVAAAIESGGIQGQAAAMYRKAAIAKEMEESGRTTQWIETAPGKFVEIKHPDHDPEMKQKQQEHNQQMFMTAQKHYGDMLSKEIKHQEELGPKDRITEESGASAEDRAKAYLARQGINPPVPPQAAPKREAFASIRPKPAVVPPPPTERQPPDRSPPKSAVAVLDDTLADFNTRPVAPEVRLEFNQTMEKAKGLLAKKGGYDKLTSEERDTYDRYRKYVKDALANAPPAPPPAQPEPPPPPSATGRAAEAAAQTIRSTPQGIRSSNPFNRGLLKRWTGG